MGCLIAMILSLGQLGGAASSSSLLSVSSHVPPNRIFLLDGLCMPPGQARVAEGTWLVSAGWMTKGLESAESTTDAEDLDWCPPGLAKEAPGWLPPGLVEKGDFDTGPGRIPPKWRP